MTPHSEIPIVRTKLHRPAGSGETVYREALVRRLQAGSRMPLTLICGAAGCGKSTVASQWLEVCGVANAWLSLEEEDGDLRTFVAYFVAAVRTAAPEACPQTGSCLGRFDFPDPGPVADCLRSDLDAIGAPFILVLDDYHEIRDPKVHELLDRLMINGPPAFRLVILSRRDPPLAISTLRARAMLTELRFRDLRFNASETAAAVEQITGRRVDQEQAERLQMTTDGWAASVHLAATAFRDRADLDSLTAGTHPGFQHMQDYLLAEVLMPLDPALQDCLYRTAIVNRFCSALCAALCRPSESAGVIRAAQAPSQGAGDAFLRALRDSGLPIIALDQGGEWVRYHHLIQDLLQRKLRERFSKEEIAALHQAASRWFEEEGLLEDAIQHALKSGDPRSAGRIVVRHRFDLSAKEQWVRMIRWLESLPRSVIESDPELLIALGESCDKRGAFSQVRPNLDKAEALLERIADENRRRELHAEIAMMRSAMSYHEGDAPAAAQLAAQALGGLPKRAASELVYATMIEAVSAHMNGDRYEAYRLIYEALQSDTTANPVSHGRLLETLCFLSWIDADLPTTVRTGRTMLDFGRLHDLPETEGWARYFLGAALYQQDDLESAMQHLPPVAENPYAPSFQLHVMAVEALALARDAGGDSSGAADLANRLLEHILRSGSTSLLTHAQALQADLMFAGGRVSEAVALATSIDAMSAPPSGYQFAIPELTVAGVLIREGSGPSLARAEAMLESLEGSLRSTHNRIHQIKALGLKALLGVRRKDEAGAVTSMQRAVGLAQPGNVVRALVDIGPDVVPLLSRLEVDDQELRFVGRLLAAFRDASPGMAGGEDPHSVSAPSANNRSESTEPLTTREKEILALLARRLSNKEIGATLFISPGTVKRHTNSIYMKLAVHGRLEAVAKAEGLGLL